MRNDPMLTLKPGNYVWVRNAHSGLCRVGWVQSFTANDTPVIRLETAIIRKGGGWTKAQHLPRHLSVDRHCLPGEAAAAVARNGDPSASSANSVVKGSQGPEINA